jgi:hypothetical protein
VGQPSLASVEKGRLLYERIHGRVRDRVFVSAVAEE